MLPQNPISDTSYNHTKQHGYVPVDLNGMFVNQLIVQADSFA